MPLLTFHWTTPALLAGAKTALRATWRPQTAQALRTGQVVPAYDRLPSVGGYRVATVRLVADPAYESLAAMPDSDYEAEGWRWLCGHPEALPRRFTREDFSWTAFERWRARPGAVWVVRFALEDVLLPRRRAAAHEPGQAAEALRTARSVGGPVAGQPA